MVAAEKELLCISNDAAYFMKIYVHLDEDSTPLPPHTLKIDDASPLSVAAVIEQFLSAYASKVF